jgi:DNA processing protein
MPLVEESDTYKPGEEKYWLAFSRVDGIGPRRLERLLSYFGCLSDAWGASAGDLMAAGVEAKLIERVLAFRKKFDPSAELARLEKLGIEVLIQGDGRYPTRLAATEGRPPLLYMRGNLLPEDELTVGVVGTRKATPYGKNVTQQLVGEMAAQGITIVSGMARGIDTFAHQAALQAGGRTIAVLGCGVDVVYPAENANLLQRILKEERGAILSEYPPGTQPEAHNFPPRNRIISGISMGVLVVETGAKGGALITVNYANEQGREVMAVPGSIFSPTSAGTHALIQQGATLVTSVSDIMQALGLAQQSMALADMSEAQEIVGDDEVERALIRIIAGGGGEPRHVDDITLESGLSTAVVSGALTMMELKGKIRNMGSMRYSLALRGRG